MAKAPIAAAIGTTAGGGASVDWRTNTTSCFTGQDLTRNDSTASRFFTPSSRPNWFERQLFHGKKEQPTPLTEKVMWTNCLPPCDPLDEDGNETSISCAKMSMRISSPTNLRRRAVFHFDNAASEAT
ncbi:hypothetical protein BD769DRAFT_1677705 [Suillus cothurnatus]|nr:hypothetical protein BD769DRAFT_1677705 [Suillus cothurnatus]